MTDLRKVAQGAPYYLATSIEECPFERFWVVLLDDEVEIYQSEEDGSLDEPSPWMRLKLLCEEQECKIMNMAYANKSFDPSVQINLDPEADGYYYTRRARKMMSANPGFSGYEDLAQGFGELRGETLGIIWELSDGQRHSEVRNLSDHPKSNHISLIRK
jgi:hypothetical protein